MVDRDHVRRCLRGEPAHDGDAVIETTGKSRLCGAPVRIANDIAPYPADSGAVCCRHQERKRWHEWKGIIRRAFIRTCLFPVTLPLRPLAREKNTSFLRTHAEHSPHHCTAHSDMIKCSHEQDDPRGVRHRLCPLCAGTSPRPRNTYHSSGATSRAAATDLPRRRKPIGL